MNILFLSDNFPPETNAPATRLHEHAREWARAGHQVTVISCAPNFPEGRVFEGWENRWVQVGELDGIRVVRVKTFITANRGALLRMLDYLSFMVMSFLVGLFQPRPDVIVGTSPQFFTVCAAWALALVRRRPFVFELRDLWPASITAVGALRPSLGLRALAKLEHFLYRRAARIVAVTEAFRAELVLRGIDGAKIDVVRNGVDLSRYRPRERDPALAEELGLAGRFTVGYLGTHGLAHALEHVLSAAERLRENEHVVFLFAGSGAAKQGLQSEARRRGLTNVIFADPRPKECMPALWSVCDLALVHLKDDPVFATVIPSKIFEAMGSGRPLLYAGPDGEAPGIVRDAGAGVWVRAEDPAALASAVEALASDPERCRELERAAAAAAPRFDRRVAAAAMLSSLEAASGTAPAEAPAPSSAAGDDHQGAPVSDQVSYRGTGPLTTPPSIVPAPEPDRQPAGKTAA